ncbi:MAG TPA: S1 RNA-binding domain-containing protein [Phycisphaerae bacterium]|nr:S1 RNA-binding domain-containing protein [Phycisphaerae bacterium]
MTEPTHLSDQPDTPGTALGSTASADPFANLRTDLPVDMSEGDAAIDRAVEEAMDGATLDDLAAAAARTPTPQEPIEGSILKGRIANIGSQDVLIDFGGKSLGAMSLTEFSQDEKYAVGDDIEVALVGGEDLPGGLLAVSRRKARQMSLLRDLKAGTIVEGVVKGMNKGGLEVDIDGLRGFIPASQVDLHFLKDISALLGQTIHAEVTKCDPNEDSIVLSRRKYQQKEDEHRKAETFAALQLGEIRRGKVRSLTEYGAFVDIGGMDGLLHVTDMSWGRVNKPEEVLKVGDEIEVKIIKLQREERKVSLSLKDARPNPWESVAQRYNVGDQLKGRVLRLQNFGAFVELEPGVEGLLPVSELSWTRRVRNPAEILKEGDVIDVKILAVDAEKRRLALSIKNLKEDPWAAAKEKYAPGTVLTGKVARTADFGAFVELEEGIDGLVHISELADAHVKNVTDKVKPGQEVEVRVLGVDTEAKKISLTMKKPPAPPSPEELARRERERQEAQKRREKRESRRGGITIGWDQGLGGLDPSKFAR